jgi:hypothetical protein
MSGYDTVMMIDRLRERAHKLGFVLGYPKHGWGDRGDVVSIRPKDQDALPIYDRNAEFFCGTLAQLRSFFDGIEWARQYDEMLKLSNTKKRERKEQDCRNRKLLQMLKNNQAGEIEK